jgi:hypothetical protein
MPAELSVTRLIGMLKGGDGEAAQRLWEAYFERLVSTGRMITNHRRIAKNPHVLEGGRFRGRQIRYQSVPEPGMTETTIRRDRCR